MKRTILFSAPLFAVTTALLAACSSSRDDLGKSAVELRVEPTGEEDWAALTIELPTNVCQPGQSCSRPLGATANVAVDGSSVAIGARTRLKPGAHTVSVNGTSTSLTLSGGQATTIVLPVAHRKCQPASLPNVPQTDFGKTVSVSNATCPSSVVQGQGQASAPTIELHWYNWSCPTGNVAGTLSPTTTAADCAALGQNTIYSVVVGGRCVDLNTNGMYGINPQQACTRYLAGDYSWASVSAPVFGDADLAFVPGDYSATIAGANTTKTFTLNEGDMDEIAIDLPVVGAVPATFGVDISFADARELPDATTATIVSSCSGDRTFAVPASTTSTLHLSAFQDSTCVYSVNAGGRSATLAQAKTNAITLHRVDVDDPVVTREDGSTYTAKGTYELYFGGNRVVGPLNTNSGIDVLPGTYEIVIQFSTADGLQTQRQTVTF